MLKIIVAYCRNKGIGVGQSLPFKLEHDMRRFKRITTGNKKIPRWFTLLWKGGVCIDNDTSFRYSIYERPDIYAKKQIPWPSIRSSSSMIPVDYR